MFNAFTHSQRHQPRGDNPLHASLIHVRFECLIFPRPLWHPSPLSGPYHMRTEHMFLRALRHTVHY